MNGVLAVFVIIGWREVMVSGDHIGQAIEIYHFCVLAVSLCYVHYRYVFCYAVQLIGVVRQRISLLTE